MPLHPAVVHLPIGLAAGLPIVAGLALARAWRDESRRDRLFDVACFLFALAIVMTTLLSSSTGEARAEELCGLSDAFVAGVREHESRAQLFLLLGIIELALAGAVVAMKDARASARRVVRVLALATAFTLPLLGAYVGHAGGELTHVLK